MATLTIRRMEDITKERLRIRASNHGRSMEEEARDILRMALGAKGGKPFDLAQSIQRRVAAVGGFDLPEIPREPMRTPPAFDE